MHIPYDGPRVAGNDIGFLLLLENVQRLHLADRYAVIAGNSAAYSMLFFDV